MTHTPGPWTIGERHRLPDTDTGEQWGYTLTAVGSTTLEQVLGATFHVATVGANPGDAECEANARLIAAAPELLAACKLALTAGDQQYVQFILRDVIAKAEGATTEGTNGKERSLD
jgi:hypothetical protein